jgi:hypothetical protein
LGLGDLEKPAELWTMIVGKDGTEYKNMFKCNSIKEFEDAEPKLSETINTEFNKWYAATGKEAAEAQLTKMGKEGGWSYKAADGNTYKLGKFNNQLQLTKIKAGGWGGKKGTFTFMRTEAVRIGPVDVVNQTLQSQGPTDSWKITKVAGESMKDMLFLMEKQVQYVPQLASTTESKKDADKKDTEEDTEE